jgi:magnesium-transporting ATPase (P-type)
MHFYLKIGDILSIDGILLEGSEVKMDESTMTGESDLRHK